MFKVLRNRLPRYIILYNEIMVLPQRNLRFVFPQPWIFVTDFDGALRMEFCSRCGKTLIFSIPTVNALMDHTILQVRHWKTQKFSCIPYKRDCSKNAETLPRFPGSTDVYGCGRDRESLAGQVHQCVFWTRWASTKQMSSTTANLWVMSGYCLARFSPKAGFSWWPVQLSR